MSQVVSPLELHSQRESTHLRERSLLAACPGYFRYDFGRNHDGNAHLEQRAEAP